MKKIYINQFLLAGTLTGCLLLASCDQEQEFTTGMPEQQLINSIELEVTSKLPLAVRAVSPSYDEPFSSITSSTVFKYSFIFNAPYHYIIKKTYT